MLTEKNEEKGLLPIRKINKQLFVDSQTVAKSLDVQHKNTLALIRRYQDSIEETFGEVAFKTLLIENKNSKVALLTEEQVAFVVTLMQNRPKVVHFKALLVKSFLYYRNQLSIIQQSKLPQRKTLKIGEGVDTNLIDLIESAIIACGSAVKLGKRLGVSPSVFSHLTRRPWLVSEEMIKAIKIGCNNILAKGTGIDTATLDALMTIDDKESRVYLYKQLKKGGLL